MPMFERNKIDNVPDASAVPVEIGLRSTARSLKGKLLVPSARALADALNGSGPLPGFEPYGGERSFSPRRSWPP